MYKKILGLFVLLTLISCSKSSNEITYPTSKKNDFTEIIHGYEISDSYRWLEEFTSEESTAWVNKQNKFSKKFISKNKFKREISNYLEKIWENESISIPYRVNGKTFYYFNDGTFQQSKLMIKDLSLIHISEPTRPR